MFMTLTIHYTEHCTQCNSRDKGIFCCLWNTFLLRYLLTKTRTTIDFTQIFKIQEWQEKFYRKLNVKIWYFFYFPSYSLYRQNCHCSILVHYRPLARLFWRLRWICILHNWKFPSRKPDKINSAVIKV